jgi:Na+-driven multidrug efflux pump
VSLVDRPGLRFYNDIVIDISRKKIVIMKFSFLKLPKDARFTNKGIILFLLPIFFEQLLISSMSIADTLMISRLPDSQYMIAAIANVTRIDTLIKQIFVALAAGGSIFVAQYVGAKKYDMSCKSLKLCLYSMTAIATLITIIMMLFDSQILNFLFGTVEKEVMKQSITYYDVTTCALPFMAMFTCCNASFRAMQKSKISFYASILLIGINLSFKYLVFFALCLNVLIY